MGERRAQGDRGEKTLARIWGAGFYFNSIRKTLEDFQ